MARSKKDSVQSLGGTDNVWAYGGTDNIWASGGGAPGQGANDGVPVEGLNEAALKENVSWGADLLGVIEVWRKTRGRGVKVAVLDTGADYDHLDLKDAIKAYDANGRLNRSRVRDFTGSPYGPKDVNGHGTHCAGIVGARQNGVGYIGIAPECDLIIGKVLGDDGRGSLATVADGVKWAVDQGADVISMSLGGRGTDHALYQAIQEALAAGRHVLCAAGNEGEIYSNSIGYPGRYGGVITIGAHDMNGRATGFSSRGGEVDFLAPGQDIWSTWPGNRYKSLNGTSMAAPFAAGVAALCLAKHASPGVHATPIENAEDLRNHLLKMVTHPGSYDSERGYGILQIYKTLYW